MLKCKSERTFGVEIETFNEDKDNFLKCQAMVDSLGFNCVHDGSIKADFPVEIVSDILKGQKGYDTIEKMCKILNKYKMGVNLSTGYHVHIGAKDFLENTIIEFVPLKDFLNYTKEFSITNKVFIVPESFSKFKVNFLYDELSHFLVDTNNWYQIENGKSYIVSTKINNSLLKLKRFNFPVCNITNIETKDTKSLLENLKKLNIEESQIHDKIYSENLTSPITSISHLNRLKYNEYLSEIRDKKIDTIKKITDIAKEQKISDNSLVLVKRQLSDNTYKVKQLFAFYLVFGDVLNSFLPKSRRGNYYCKDLNTKYNLEEIMKIKTFDDFDKVWYKEKNTHHIKILKGGKYHESRYYYTNFHSLARHGTIEIRSHSGTTQFRKIIRWLHLHLEIVDKVSEDKKFDDFIYMANQVSDLETKTRIMFDYLGTDKDLVEVWLERQKLLKNK